MKFIALLLLISSFAGADTPVLPYLKLKGGTDGTIIGNVGDAIKTNGTFSGSIMGAVSQGAAGTSPWLFSLPTGAATSALQSSLITALGSPLQQSGGSVGLSGTLPAFGATPTFNLGTLNGAALDTSLQTIDTDLKSGAAKVQVTNFPATQPVSATALPLPTGASTSANQTSQITQETATATSVAAIAANQTSGAEKVQVVSSIPNADIIVSGTMGTSGAVVTENVSGIAEGVISIFGPFVGGINVQCVYPGSVTANLATLQAAPTLWSSAAITVPGNFKFRGGAGCPKLQAVYASYTSGSPTVTIAASSSTGNPIVSQPNSSSFSAGAWFNNSGAQIQGTADSSGNQNVNVVNSALQTAANASLAQIVTNTGAAATDFTNTGNITAVCAAIGSCAAGSTVAITGQGVYTVSFSLSGTWVGDVVFDGQLADGSWVQVPATVVSPTLPYAYVPASGVITNGVYIVTGGGFLNVRARALAYTSGTIAVGIDGSLSQQNVIANVQGSLSLGFSVGKTIFDLPGTLASVATTANQVVTGTSHTVTAGKTFYIQGWDCNTRVTTLSATNTFFGTCSLMINGALAWTQALYGLGYSQYLQHDVAEPIAVPAGQVVQMVVTPSSATSYTWTSNLLGYEK